MTESLSASTIFVFARLFTEILFTVRLSCFATPPGRSNARLLLKSEDYASHETAINGTERGVTIDAGHNPGRALFG